MVDQVLLGVVPPALIAALVLLVAWRPWQRTPVENAGWGPTVACGLAVLAGYLAIEGRPQFPPPEKWQWILYLGLAAMGLGLVDLIGQAARWRPRWTRGLAGPLAAAAALLMLRHPSPEAQPLWKAGLGLAVLLSWAALEPLARRRPGASIPLALLLSLAGAGAVIVLSGNAKLAGLAGALAAAMGAAVVVAWWQPRLSLAHGAVVVVVVVLSGLLFLGQAYTYSSVPVVSFLLPIVAPAAAWIVEVPALRGMGAARALLLRAGAVLVVVAVAVGLALYASLRSD